VHASFLECFKRRGVGVGHSGFGIAFGEGPSSAAAGPDQQKFKGLAPLPVADRGYLFAVTKFAKM
jgi:hypothetical protein